VDGSQQEFSDEFWLAVAGAGDMVSGLFRMTIWKIIFADGLPVLRWSATCLDLCWAMLKQGSLPACSVSAHPWFQAEFSASWDGATGAGLSGILAL
jgi:hypothetical protein